jgi:type I restriction-modification system DNA methylase subunit
MDKEQARKEVAALLAKEQGMSEAARRRENEEATKQGLILPLFRALGWDTDNTNEVAPEVKAGSGRVDYAFRIGGIARFYLEAKPLAEPLDNHVKQAVSYAYNKGIPYAVLTNFRDLWAFTADVVERPPRFLSLSADQYLTAFDDLWFLSKDAVTSGTLEEEAIKRGASPPRIKVEDRLLKQFREWREQLFKELRQWHGNAYPLPVFDEVIQRLLSRLIFLRTAEDRHIQDRVLLTLLHNYRDRTLRGTLLAALRRVFQDCDAVYDSELFQDHPVLDHAAGIVDTTLADILSKLYQIPGGYSEYDFSAIDADVLGRVYEQYLGFVAQEARRVQVEIHRRMDLGMPEDQALAQAIEVVSKPERRKAQGIYYTPKWVVDYTVRQTVGKFIKEHENRPDAIHNIRILDPACGSGSFLIRAYDELLDWHARQSRRTPDKLFSDERLAILRNNIFGVDLDPQAVEVARLSLLLRALRERQKLPTLGDNIKRGNSLLPDGSLEQHPFDWNGQFSKVMAEGGFDVVIGNPPYIKEYVDSKPFRELRGTPLAKYYQGKMDIWYIFASLAIDLLKPGGLHSFIATSNWITNAGARLIRQKVATETRILDYVDFGEFKVFENVGIQTMIYVMQKTKPSAKRPTAYIR